jgi:predicted DNA-binding protein with PD1-like motif
MHATSMVETRLTEYTNALVLPRARTLVHPGPVGPIRIEHRHANRARHFRLALEPGRTMEDALIEPLSLLGVRSASMTLLGGQLETLLYCVAPPDPTGERVANYTRPIPAGPATLIFGNATLGKNARGEAIVHCHATFVCADGQVRGGHIVADRSVVGATPVPVLVTSLGIELRITQDAETHMPLMRPFAASRQSEEASHAV